MAITVELKAFDGPLDLLLHLIDKNKVNIFDIPIVEITEQYLAYVKEMEQEDLNVMSEFMVMASELISIKCRMLLPPEVDEEGEEIDPREELVQKLLEYKIYKYMSFELREQLQDASKHAFKPNTTPKEVLAYRPEVSPEELMQDITLRKLHDIFSQVMKRQTEKLDPQRSHFGKIEEEKVHFDERLEHIQKLARERGRFSFREVLDEKHGRMMIIVSFLAVLQMIRYGILTVEQEVTDGDIYLTYIEGTDISLIHREESDGNEEAV